jgi:hypothetical protein
MDKAKLLELALVEWIALLKSRDRSRTHVRTNFEDLFQKWKDLEGSFDDLYETLLPKAIKAHQPLPSIARSTYKTLKSRIDKTEKEFIDEWNSSIEATGQEAFFEFFPAVAFDKDDEPKVYGNMSATEYRAQRRYADQFPTLDTTELVKAWREQKQYNPAIDDQLENILGSKKDETNS